jgi:hypothetical protein
VDQTVDSSSNTHALKMLSEDMQEINRTHQREQQDKLGGRTP